MATNKRPRKKYCKKRLYLIDTARQSHVNPIQLVAHATSNKPLSDETINAVLTGYTNFLDLVKSGKATGQNFFQMCECHYLYVALLEVMKRAKVNFDNADDYMQFKLRLSILLDIAIDSTTDVLEGIATREKKTNKFILTGDEIKHIEQSISDFKWLLEIASWQHYIAALKESEPILNQEAHRQRRKKDWRQHNEIFSTFINLFFSRINRLLNHLLHKNANNQKQ